MRDFSWIREYPGIAVEGFGMVTRPPTTRFCSLTVTEVHRRNLLDVMRERRREVLTIDMDLRVGGDGEPHKQQISIDIERELLTHPSSAWLFDQERKGSGEMGLAFLALPAILLTLPLSIPIACARSARERFNKMDRHVALIVKKLDGQLEPEVYELLKRAAHNSWQETQRRKHNN